MGVGGLVVTVTHKVMKLIKDKARHRHGTLRSQVLQKGWEIYREDNSVILSCWEIRSL